MDLTKRLENKIIVITGASTGIGRACALRYAKEGGTVVVGDINEVAGATLIEEIKAMGKEAVFVKTDVTKDEDLDNLLKTAVDNFGRIDVLHSNAGIANVATLEELKMEDFDRIYQINTRAPIALCKKAIPYLKETKGNILNTASVSGIRAQLTGYAYNSSKAALIMATQIMALEFASMGIRVNALCPGITQTEILSQTDPVVFGAIEAAIPMKRVAQPEEIAAAAAFAISDDASYMTGHTLEIDGGQMAM